MDAASPAARDVLAARLTDPDIGTRCEALLARAKAGDCRAVAVLGPAAGLWPEDRLDEREVRICRDPRAHRLADDRRASSVGGQGEARAHCRIDLYGIKNAGLGPAVDLRPRGLRTFGHSASGRSLRCSP